MRLGCLSSILFAVAVSVALPASAESPPPGSYQGTCTNIKVQKLLGGPGKNLTATCQKKSGKPVDAVLALPCGGDIRNENGNLVCKSGPNPFAPPPGSYMAQCKNADMAGPTCGPHARRATGRASIPPSTRSTAAAATSA